MEILSRIDIIHQTHHLSWLEQARIMADGPSAVESGLSLDNAYRAISTLALRRDLNPLVGKILHSDEPAAEMNADTFFRTADAIDTVLLHGNPEQANDAATFAAELASALPFSTQPKQKRDILASVLGIELASDVPVTRQLVERRLPEGTFEEQRAMTASISAHMRTV